MLGEKVSCSRGFRTLVIERNLAGEKAAQAGDVPRQEIHEGAYPREVPPVFACQQPELRVLIYEPQADGSLELVAVENLVFARAWKEAGHDASPAFHGVTYDTMVDNPSTSVDEAHLFEPHHDRHVWIYRENPNGVFAPFNPAVTCEHHRNSGAHQQHASGG